MTDPLVVCKAAAISAGGTVTVGCAQLFLGIPREVLYAAMAGACAGVAQNKNGWDKFLAPGKFDRVYVAVALRGMGLALTLAFNALVCSWIAQLLQHVPLTAGAAKVLPMATAGVLAWGSQRILPELLDSTVVYIRRKLRGDAAAAPPGDES